MGVLHLSADKSSQQLKWDFSASLKWPATFSPPPPVNIIKLLNPPTRSETRLLLLCREMKVTESMWSIQRLWFYKQVQSVDGAIATGAAEPPVSSCGIGWFIWKNMISLQNPDSWKGFLWGDGEIISVMPAGFLCLACRRMNRINKKTKMFPFPLKRDVLGTNGKPVLDIFILSSFKQTSPSANIGSCAQRVDICEQKQPISGALGLRMWVTRSLIHSLTLWYHSAFLLCSVLTSISSAQESIAGFLFIKTCSDSWWGCKPGCDTACCVYSLFGSDPRHAAGTENKDGSSW